MGQTMQKRLLVTVCALGFLTACAPKEAILEGERFKVRSPLALSLATENNPTPQDQELVLVNQVKPITLPKAQALGSWAQRAGSATHMGHHGVWSAEPKVIWSASIGKGESRSRKISAAPVVGGGLIFTIDADNQVMASNALTGVRLWAASLAPAKYDGGSLTSGGLAYGKGIVFAGSAYGELVAFDALSGAELWRQRIGAPISSAPSVDGNTVYVVGRDASAWAIVATSGKVKWQITGTPSLAGMVGTAAPAITDSAAIIPFVSGELVYVLKKTGVKLWSTAIAGRRIGQAYASVGDITGDPVVAGDRVYVGNQSGRSMALNLTNGAEVWSSSTGAYGPMLVISDAIFLISDHGALIRLDRASGQTVWSVTLPHFKNKKAKKRRAVYAHFGPVLAGGRLVVASSDSYLRSFDPVSGALLSAIEMPSGAATLPALAGDMLYVLTTKGEILAFR